MAPVQANGTWNRFCHDREERRCVPLTWQMRYRDGMAGKRLSIADVTLEFTGERLRRLVESQRNVEESLADMRQRLQSVETNGNLRREVYPMQADIIRIDYRLDHRRPNRANLELAGI